MLLKRGIKTWQPRLTLSFQIAARSASSTNSSATKAGVRGVKKVANDAERVAKNVVDPFQIFHDDEE